MCSCTKILASRSHTLHFTFILYKYFRATAHRGDPKCNLIVFFTYTHFKIIKFYSWEVRAEVLKYVLTYLDKKKINIKPSYC